MWLRSWLLGGATASHRSISSDPTARREGLGRRLMTSRNGPMGDDEVAERFEELFEAHYRKIVTYARRRTRSVEDADDVAGATFTVAWSRVDDFVGADEPLAWLFAVAYRTVLSQRRDVDKTMRLAEKAAASSFDAAESVESIVEAHDEMAHITAAAATLSEKDQELLRLVGWEERTHAEIAEILDISRVLVRTQILRARRRLRADSERLLDDSAFGGAGS